MYNKAVEYTKLRDSLLIMHNDLPTKEHITPTHTDLISKLGEIFKGRGLVCGSLLPQLDSSELTKQDQ